MSLFQHLVTYVYNTHQHTMMQVDDGDQENDDDSLETITTYINFDDHEETTVDDIECFARGFAQNMHAFEPDKRKFVMAFTHHGRSIGTVRVLLEDDPVEEQEKVDSIKENDGEKSSLDDAINTLRAALIGLNVEPWQRQAIMAILCTAHTCNCPMTI